MNGYHDDRDYPRLDRLHELVSRLVPNPHRSLVLGITWILVGVLASFGFSYALGGIRVVANIGPYAVWRHQLEWVGGVKAHGWIMVAIAGLLVSGVGPTLWGYPYRRDLLAAGHFIAGAYCYFTAVAFLCAPLAGGKESLGPIWWFAGGTAAYLLFIFPPKRSGVTGSGTVDANLTTRAG